MRDLRIGVDVGSTTLKVVVINEENKIIYKEYLRHFSNIASSLLELLSRVDLAYPNIVPHVNFTGSAGLLLADGIDIQFTQEVIAATKALRLDYPDIDVCIELGGEDAKIIFFDGSNVEQRMNGTCAGGTGAFIDQMASLLNIESSDINELAKDYERIYPIASRCGVFAKSDIQPLLNQGAKHEDIAASIYQAIVNQTIAGLCQGRKIKGKVAFLGGPLSFASELRKRFIETLKLEDIYLPDSAETFVAYGASLAAEDTAVSLKELMERISSHAKKQRENIRVGKKLFKSKADYEQFKKRHLLAEVKSAELSTYAGDAFLGVDAGSTTTKIVLISELGEILYQFYANNKGNPVDVVKEAVLEMYSKMNEKTFIKGSYSTGYGEHLIKNALQLDSSEVETVCHYRAAKFFNPDVDFVIDIGGQDMKCFKIENGAITSIIINEACSSGCGSFIETFASSLGHEVKEFADMAVESSNPVDLGTRCTVFMNSGVKQAQAEAAKTEDIAAGLAISVVKNALYKVIRAVNVKEEFGNNIIVQGGTFLNDAILRSFEQEIGSEVIRPSIAGLMGAFGAALLAREHKTNDSTILSKNEIENLEYIRKTGSCKLCGNNCQLNINIFNGKKYISGNRCERGIGKHSTDVSLPNLYLYKYDKIMSYKSDKENYKGTVGLPLVMNMYENIPFWFTFFDELGFEVVYSGRSNKKMYELGQDSIPSDTVCYPAKLAHGHIESLLLKDIDFIFYPNMQFNITEKDYSDNFYNCPIVAHYPELIDANMDNIKQKPYMKPYVSLNTKKQFVKNLLNDFKELDVSKKELMVAYDKGMSEYQAFRQDITVMGEMAFNYARSNDLNIVVLAGRPYHIDPEINHGIPSLLRSLGLVVVSEDAINTNSDQEKVNILNQWTYHTRLYDAAKFVTTSPKTSLIQLVSFGCGLDAITTDEVRSILEKGHKLYTQIKIDEVINLGAANIRIRSLISTMEGN